MVAVSDPNREMVWLFCEIDATQPLAAKMGAVGANCACARYQPDHPTPFASARFAFINPFCRRPLCGPNTPNALLQLHSGMSAMTGRKRSRPANPLFLGLDAWLLGLDSAMVIGLRTLRIAGGGAAAHKESQDMVTEKLLAMIELPMKLARSGVTSPVAVTQSTLRHYSKKVRANRKRLSRGSTSA